VGRTNYLLKTLQFKRICPTQACTTPRTTLGIDETAGRVLCWWRRACRFGRLFMFKSNCGRSHFFIPWLSFLTPATLPSWPTRQTVVERAASAKRAPWPIAAHLCPMHCQTACSYIAAAAWPRPSACSRSPRPCPHDSGAVPLTTRGQAPPSGCVETTARTALQVVLVIRRRDLIDHFDPKIVPTPDVVIVSCVVLAHGYPILIDYPTWSAIAAACNPYSRLDLTVI
jgi:hypothetical protein